MKLGAALIQFFFLIYCKDIKNVTLIDISGCVSLDPTSLIDICELFNCLKYLIFRDCKQFKETHLMRMADLCQNLVYVDGTGAGCVSATFALGILYNLPKLCKFAVTPLASDANVWSFIVFQFSRIYFGLSIAATINCHGDIVRFAQNALKEIFEA